MGIIAYIFGGIGRTAAYGRRGGAALVHAVSRGRHGYAHSAGVVLRHKGAGTGQEEARQGLYRHDGGHMRMHTGGM